MRPFAFAQCQLHLSDSDHMLCDYKHQFSFRELSACNLDPIISTDACTATSDEDCVIIFFSFSSLHRH